MNFIVEDLNINNIDLFWNNYDEKNWKKKTFSSLRSGKQILQVLL